MEKYKTAHEIKRWYALLVADGIEVPAFGEKG